MAPPITGRCGAVWPFSIQARLRNQVQRPGFSRIGRASTDHYSLITRLRRGASARIRKKSIRFRLFRVLLHTTHEPPRFSGASGPWRRPWLHRCCTRSASWSALNPPRKRPTASCCSGSLQPRMKLPLSLETRRRIEMLLKQLEEPVTDSSTLQHIPAGTALAADPPLISSTVPRSVCSRGGHWRSPRRPCRPCRSESRLAKLG
jgi:hypothetical protein